MPIVVGRPSEYLPCDRRISMVTDDVHTAFAEHIKSIIAFIVNSIIKAYLKVIAQLIVGIIKVGWIYSTNCCLQQSCINVSSKVHSLTRGEHLPP